MLIVKGNRSHNTAAFTTPYNFCQKSVAIPTNLIESFNKQIKRYSRRKEQFQNEESLERFLVSIFDTYNQKFLNRSHKGFQQVTDTLVSMFTE
jgi:transposase-like protein